MIKINDRFEIDQAPNGWTLWESVPGTSKQGEPIIARKPYYYGNLAHVCACIVDLSAGDASDIAGVIAAIDRASADCRAALVQMGVAA